jgi:hypothetical protein
MKHLSKLFFCITLLGLLGTSCVTQKACMEKFPIKETHDTLIVYRDTIIKVPVFSVDDTTIMWGSVHDTVYASSGTAHAITYVVRDTLRLTVWQSDTTILVKLDSAIKVISQKDTEIYTIQKECKKTKFDRYLNKIVAIVFAFVFIAILIFAKNLFK